MIDRSSKKCCINEALHETQDNVILKYDGFGGVDACNINGDNK